MAKISFEVDNKNLNTVITIIKNLKVGLIKNLKIDEKNSTLEKVSKPVSLGTNKYLSKEQFKQKLKKSAK
ncbi:hypothetical protein CP960_05695 [Malaciobacter halophilus]|uniref:Uncharacterized protein n=1 Tax=Malaciobacter halophilus TaxID=197482 RepID=A0A2N1J3C1_9BACT|nr:hypothetical protein [Malaciobacter halophilus]AXH09154.1 hypothetical protein AHALO_0769 [Malaciobacter halophilus]PKI81050.1 hypothetical protein CP960_05695 [Malaciobacter halophilus]